LLAVFRSQLWIC